MTHARPPESTRVVLFEPSSPGETSLRRRFAFFTKTLRWRSGNTATVLKGVSTVSGLLAIIAAGLQPEVAPPLAGLSAVTAVGGEAADASPCRGERVVAQATQIVLTAGVSGAFAEGGAHGLSKLVDSTSFAFGAGGAVSC